MSIAYFLKLLQASSIRHERKVLDKTGPWYLFFGKNKLSDRKCCFIFPSSVSLKSSSSYSFGSRYINTYQEPLKCALFLSLILQEMLVFFLIRETYTIYGYLNSLLLNPDKLLKVGYLAKLIFPENSNSLYFKWFDLDLVNV